MADQLPRLKLSEASARCGIPPRVLKLMASDDLFAQVERGQAGHFYFPDSNVPTWSECIAILEEERDRQLRRASATESVHTRAAVMALMERVSGVQVTYSCAPRLDVPDCTGETNSGVFLTALWPANRARFRLPFLTDDEMHCGAICYADKIPYVK